MKAPALVYSPDRTVTTRHDYLSPKTAIPTAKPRKTPPAISGVKLCFTVAGFRGLGLESFGLGGCKVLGCRVRLVQSTVVD